jgi:hypothetical protein
MPQDYSDVPQVDPRFSVVSSRGIGVDAILNWGHVPRWARWLTVVEKRTSRVEWSQSASSDDARIGLRGCLSDKPCGAAD